MEYLAIVAAALCFGVLGLLVGQRIGHEKGVRETTLAAAERMRQIAHDSAQRIKSAEDAKLKAENAQKAGEDQLKKLERQVERAERAAEDSGRDGETAHRQLHNLLKLAEAVVTTGSRNAMLKLQQAVEKGAGEPAAASPATTPHRPAPPAAEQEPSQRSG